MYNKLYQIFYILSILLGFSSCTKDLDTIPLDQDILTAGTVYDDPNAYLQVLSKLYAGYAVTGQQGPSGQADIEGIDEGFGQYLRMYWYHQELSTDEALVGWNDQTIADFHDQDWSAEDGFIFAMYSRIFYQIAICNEYVRETSDAKLSDRGVDQTLAATVRGYRAEARFLRALSYWHALDLFRNVPFVTEEDAVGSFFPEQIQAPDLVNYIESELLAIESEIAEPRSNPYGRADRAAVWMLLAKLYLNAEVYTGTARYDDCLEYCNRLINSSYSLDPMYENLFLADNHTSPEIIFPITFDGVSTRTWGGMTFIIRAGIGGEMDPTASGVVSGWGGTRTTRQLIEKFPDNLGGIVVERNNGDTRRYSKIYVPGAYQGWDAGNSTTTLSSPNGDRIFEGYKYFPEANSPFFFTQVPAFALILGDNDGDGILENDGDTIVVPEAGLYYIQVNLNNNSYVLEKQTWGILGDATEVGWEGDDIDLIWDPDIGALTASLDLQAGEFKFRANDAWDVNLGDNERDGVLDLGGDNLVIEEGGPYDVVLYLDQPDYGYSLSITSFDTRGMFFSIGQSIDIEDITLFTDGYAVEKFKNITSDGQQGSDTDFPDTDFPMFRLADAYLMGAEAILRGASGGDRATALSYVNQVRARAFGGSGGGISDEALNLDMIIDERAREFYWECHRRTDLVRFGDFSNTDYTWAWKGGVMEGRSVEAFRDVYPIPSSDLGANPNLQQNQGY